MSKRTDASTERAMRDRNGFGTHQHAFAPFSLLLPTVRFGMLRHALHDSALYASASVGPFLHALERVGTFRHVYRANRIRHKCKLSKTFLHSN